MIVFLYAHFDHLSAGFFRGKIILLTGGAGLYGRGLTALLARTGATLVLASRNVAALETVAAEERALGHLVQAESLDQGEEASVLALRDRLVAQFGRIDGLVNNAVSRPMKSADARWLTGRREDECTGLFAITRVWTGHGKQGQHHRQHRFDPGHGRTRFQPVRGLAIPDYFFHKAW
jgi:NADP-dependent 3-hydroxy acid dehydrogenase YdfG